MNFQELHELLRLELLRRIDQGELTGTRLAQQTGFRQAHISNFLNRRRSLSLEGLDRVLAAQGLTVDQILPLALAATVEKPLHDLPTTDRPPLSDATKAATGPATEEAVGAATEAVPVVSLSAAADEPRIQPASVIEAIHLSASQLSVNRPRPAALVAAWQRFVAIRPNAQETAAMLPILAPGSIAVIDRHYNSVAPYRPEQPTLLAVRYGSGLLLRFVELDDGRLILRPSSVDYPLHFLTVGASETPAHCIVGRVCLLIREL